MSSSGVHQVAQAFNLQTDAYERARPGYPEAAVEYIIEETGLRQRRADGRPRRVLDLAAGTGKFTRQLQAKLLGEAASSDEYVLEASEPVAGMRAAFGKILPEVRCLSASAAELGSVVEAGQIDVLTVAQAFHWFADAESLRAMHRALAPGGHLVLLWNDADRDVGWIRQMRDAFEAFDDGVPQYRTQQWRRVFAEQAALPRDHPERLSFDVADPLAVRTFPNEHLLTVDEIWLRVLSISYVGALPPERQATLRDAIVALVESHFPHVVADRSARIPLAYITNVFVLRKDESRT